MKKKKYQNHIGSCAQFHLFFISQEIFGLKVLKKVMCSRNSIPCYCQKKKKKLHWVLNIAFYAHDSV